MGKKGKRSTKTGDGKAKQGPGKARREEAAALREVKAGITALAEKLESETKDVELFGPLTEQDDCPICFLPMPRLVCETVYMPCCGQSICGGCLHASIEMKNKTKKKALLCAFCRWESAGAQKDEVTIEEYRKRAEKNDLNAIESLAVYHRDGKHGLQKDQVAALRLYLRAAELGSLQAISSLAQCFYCGDMLLEQDYGYAMKLSTEAAKRGYLDAYFGLGCIYNEHGYPDDAVKILTFAARGGSSKCMEYLQANNTRIGDHVVSGEDLELIEKAYEEAAKLDWSEEREAYKERYQRKRNPVY